MDYHKADAKVVSMAFSVVAKSDRSVAVAMVDLWAILLVDQ